MPGNNLLLTKGTFDEIQGGKVLRHLPVSQKGTLDAVLGSREAFFSFTLLTDSFWENLIVQIFMFQ